VNREELEILYGYDEFVFKLYFAGIRRYMDYKTGIVGIKRGISWQSLRDMTRIESRSGVKEKLSSESKVRRAVKTLMRIGLIKNISTPYRLIFECPIATRDNSVQNKVDGRPTPLTIGDADTINSVYEPTTMRSAKPMPIEADTEADTGLGAEADTPPLSVKELKEKELLRSSKKKRQLPPDFDVTEHHIELATRNNWPYPKDEIEAFRDYHMARGTTMIDWDRAFFTWLRNAKKFAGGKQSGNQTKPTSFNRAVENILNSAKGS
jgi:hypothetical protein